MLNPDCLVVVYCVYVTVFCRVLAKGSRLLCLWTSAQGAAAAAGSTGNRKRVSAERIVLQVGGGASSICSRSISSGRGFSSCKEQAWNFIILQTRPFGLCFCQKKMTALFLF